MSADLMRDGESVRVVADEAALASAAAEVFRQAADEAIAASGRFTVALSGGRTPLGTYTRLGDDEAFRAGVRWQHTHLYWSDERMVAPSDPRSNFGTARDALIDRVPIPVHQVTRVYTELGSADLAAADYETRLCQEFGVAAGRQPRFDLVLLGLGLDGHTASLFPETAAVAEQVRSVVPVPRPVPDIDRVSMTLPAINAAARIVVLVSGENKAARFAQVLRSADGPRALPAARLRPQDGSVLWLVDRAAARQWSKSRA